MTAGIGSLPLAGPDEGAQFVLDADLSIPFWPQLPKRCFAEQMIPQYSRAMPCVEIDAEAKKISFDPAVKMEQLQRFYEQYISEDLEAFALPREYAEGFYAFLDAAAGRTWPVVKGQVTGPITFTTGINDADKNPLYNDAELRDAAVKLLTRNAQWQVERLKPFADEAVLMFVDEPVLAAFGSSSYVGISAGDVASMCGEIFQAVNEAGGITGMHVCGNSDWDMVISTGVQVVNFDAYQYGTTMGLYPEKVGELFDRGGYIAWGIVPTSGDIHNENADTLAEKFDSCVASLENKGFSRDLVIQRSLLTPSCGVGSMSPEDAREVFDTLRQLRGKLSGTHRSEPQTQIKS